MTISHRPASRKRRSLIAATAFSLTLGVMQLGAAGTAQAAVPANLSAPAPLVAAADARDALPAGTTAIQGTLDDGTRTVSFNNDWKFALVNSADITDPTGAFATAQDPAFNDSSWRTLNLPHDWSIEGSPVTGTGTGTAAGSAFYQGGLGWYRKTFTLPASLTGKKISVEFDGIYMDSYIYVNGTQVANHPYGYTGFNVDLTPYVHTDGTPNVIAVKVQNKIPSSRWYSGSGIYRNTHLVVTDPVHVARWGTFVTTPTLATEIASHQGTAHITNQIANGSGTDTTVTVNKTIKDAAGATVGSSSAPLVLPVAGALDTADIVVPNPHLWSTTDPYLYTVTTDVVSGGTTLDSTTTTFGFRYYTITADDGMTLNGQYIKLQGVDLHHDLGALGSAVNLDATRRQLEIMKSMGVNAYRTSHNPPSPEIMQLCEEMGIVVMVEAFDSWQNGKNTYDYGRFWAANGVSDIKEMVNSNKNSPSVIMWSIGNEIPDSTSTAGLTMAQTLVTAIKSVDTSRYVVIGSDKYRSVPSGTSATAQILGQLDGLGLNYNTAKSVDGLHTAFPTKFLFESESSSETSSRGVYQDPAYLNTGENYTPGKRGASSYDNNLASWTMSGEYGLKKDRDRKYFLGEFLWSGIDYLGEPTPYSVFPVKSSSFGAVDTAGFPKDMYYLFQSQWTTTPMVHILPMNWTDYTVGQNVPVWVYSNADTVELYLNGVSLGSKSFDTKTTTDGRTYLETTEATGDDKTFTTGPYIGSYTSPNGSAGKLHLEWNVPFAKGELKAVAKKNGVVVSSDVLNTAGVATTTTLTPDKLAIAADGHSMSFVTVDVVDKNGVMVPSANNQLNFTVTGGGSLVGLDNGNPESAESYKSTSRAAFNGKALAMIESDTSGTPITVTVTGAGLEPQTTTIFTTTGAATGSDDTVGSQPVYLRAKLGTDPELPIKVTGVHGDGTTEQLALTWNALPAAAATTPGVYTVEGTITGAIGVDSSAVITVYSIAEVDGYSGVTTPGTAPMLPGTVRTVDTDGTVNNPKVTWDAVPASSYAAAGSFTVQGTVPGTSVKAVASIRVAADAPATTDIAKTAGTYKPVTDASYSGAVATIPSAMIDASLTTGWSNYYNKAATALLAAVSKANASDWVSVNWPSAYTIGSIKPSFTLTAGRHVLPSAVVVSYWNGSAWTPVTNQVVTWATATNTASTISFDPVNTTGIRLTMTSPAPGSAAGFVQIVNLDVLAKAVTYSSNAALTDLKVGTTPVANFDPATTTYSAEVTTLPITVTGTAADNGSVAVTLPITLPGTAKVVVTSEDGSATKTYTVNLTAGALPTVSLSAPTVPASGWYTGPVLVTATGASTLDPHPTVKYRVDGGAWQPYTAAVSVSGSAVHTVEAQATDTFGHTSAVELLTVKIDGSAPSVSATVSAADPAVVEITAADPLSGVALTEYKIGTGAWTTYTTAVSVPRTYSNITVSYRATDVAGNTSAVESTTVAAKVDTTAPTTTLTTAPAAPNGANGWYTGDVTVTLAGADDAQGSGLQSTEYQLDGGAWTTYAAPLVISAEGTYTVAYRSTDVSGNVEATRTTTVKLDKTAPLTGPLVQDLSATAVSVTLVSADSTSGVAKTEYRFAGGTFADYTGVLTVQRTAAARTIEFRSTNNAGLVEATHQVVVPALPTVLESSSITATVTGGAVATDKPAKVSVVVTAPRNLGGELVTLYSGSTLVGAATLVGNANGGSVTASVWGLPAGTSSLVAKYAGNAAVDGSSSSPVTVSVYFSDVAPSNIFFGDVNWLLSRQITTGYDDGTFRPTGSVNRIAMAAFLYRMTYPGQAITTCATAPFPDVPAGNEFCSAVKWLSTSGITTGNSDGKFHPNDAVTREAMGAFLFRLTHPGQAIPACTTAPFPDVTAGNQFCGAIKWLATAGITTGNTDGKFHPSDPVSRQAMAAFLHRVANLG
ncbi:DUF4982 domain-containing protein [Nakamurella silvestris]|nr:DUF4982 domain-containing protein [Nakamurella silvestris]